MRHVESVQEFLPLNNIVPSESALSTVEPRLRAMVDALPAYIAYVDTELRYTMVNRTYEEWFGRPASEMLGRTVGEVLGDSLRNVQEHLKAALKGETQRFEARLRTVTGDRVLFVVHLPDRDETGAIRGVIIHGHDVTDRVLAEEQLRLSEERLRLALSAADGVGTWDWDVTADLVRADPTFARLYGVPVSRAASGAPIAAFTRNIHPEDAERVGEAIARTLEACGDFAAEYRLLMEDGTVRWVFARGRCTLAENGINHRFPGVVIDITARKQGEEALLQTEKLAAVGRLASSIAHEINNPLESVVNLLYLIESSSTETETRTYAHVAQDELARVSQIVTQTLRFFKQSTLPSVIRPAELIDSIVTLYRGRLANSAIEVKLEIRDEASGLLCEGEVRQILNNLVGNAIDAMREHGGQLTLRARGVSNERNGGKGVRLIVADTGTGMGRETLNHIFEPFFTTKGARGTGLGLWVSKQLSEKNHGRLRVRSSIDPRRHGTVFSLFLPYVSAESVAS